MCRIKDDLTLAKAVHGVVIHPIYERLLRDSDAVIASLSWNNGKSRGLRQIETLKLPQTDVFLLAFSLISKASYENVAKKWIPELKHHAPNIPIILVGTKLDLRDDKHFFIDHPDAVPITSAQGEDLKKLTGATAYMECSSKTQQNLKAVFDAAIKVVLQSKRKKGQKVSSIM